MTTPRQPDRLPRGVESWTEWHEIFSAHRQDFVTEQIDRIRYRALLSLLGFSARDIEAEITDAFDARRKWRLANQRSAIGE